MFFIC